MRATATPVELDPPIGDDHRTAMCGDVVASADNVTQLIPGTSTRLSHVSDGELLSRTRQLVGKSNLLFAALLEHLAEVEARGLHRTRRCASLYTYCIYELRFSEDAAARRSSAAKLVRRFPAILDAIAKGELHLTGLLMLGPHLTEANHVEVLGRAKFRTKKEIGKLVRSALCPMFLTSYSHFDRRCRARFASRRGKSGWRRSVLPFGSWRPVSGPATG